DADTALVERFDGNLVSLADLAEHARARHSAIVEEQFAGAARANAELVFLPADGESWRPSFDDEGGDPAIPGIGIHARKHDEQVRFVGVRDPHLPPAQDPLA